MGHEPAIALSQRKNGATTQGQRGAKTNLAVTSRAGRDINKGIRKPALKKVEAWESKHHNDPTEHLAIFDDHGRLMGYNDNGTESSVAIRNVFGDISDTIIVHNHPSKDKSKAGRINVTLSSADVGAAISRNAAEIRATSPTYTYSLKRPKSGWGVSANKAKNEVQSGFDKLYDASRSYARRGNRENMRANVVLQDQNLRTIAKKYGWTYTRTKTSK